jgi:succinyl-CoA synthetase beta subunit
MAFVLRLLTGKRGKYARVNNEEERRTVQEIYSELERMAKRIESLETLLIEEFRHSGTRGTDSDVLGPPPFR